ncbi:hypothetical protein [Paracoccus fontiphilus]|uniref:Methyltransferase domain-containing protein n=1 Tax=Paracoccus fontiphilus TaxID=1815556 RepID=A0ABV7IJR1_9RHOB|nr:hypothetical protein [Paracoccus fontiphilus]
MAKSSQSMPAAEVKHLTEAYHHARVILEYGSGASTRIASAMPRKYVLSVESDRQWARNLRADLRLAQHPGQVIVYYVDIGPTGPWGRVLNDREWRSFHRYPNAIWQEPYFRHPDVILIDGRFRTACLISAMLQVTKPVIVLFDDYVDRPKYQLVEKLITPQKIIGRMAHFQVEPNTLHHKDVSFAIEQFFQVTEHGQGSAAYKLDQN